MTNYILAVNYTTSMIVDEWFLSIKENIPDAITVIVDNFSTDEERKKILEKCETFDIYLVESENIGYGAALNKGLKYIKDTFKIKDSDIIMMGNIDIKFKFFRHVETIEPSVLMPSIIEQHKYSSRNRNPFLTKMQSNLILLYKYDAVHFIWIRFMLIVFLFKLLGVMKSKPYAVHGSIFCFNGALAKISNQLFNEKSFLYCEEIDFAKFIEKSGFPIISWDTEIQHSPHASTFTHYSKASSRIALWQQSFLEYLIRWTR